MVVTALGGSVAAGNVSGGIHQHRHEHAAPRQPAAWPYQVGVIPSRADCFQVRAAVARLAEVLAGGGTAVVGSADQVPSGGVLVGMGGVGKTQLAANFARTAWQAGEVDVLVWITAASRTAIVTRLAQAANEVLGLDSGDPERDARAFLAWLEPKSGQRVCRWLVVLDDVSVPADLNSLWPPPSPHGRTVATTRCRDAALARQGRRMVDVELFTEAEAVAYLVQTLAVGGRREPEGELAALARDLGRLPLALAQAAAYLLDAGIGCADYRALLADRTRTLADAAPEALPDDQPRPVAAAWSLSIDRADTLRPVGLAVPLLRLAAFLDSNGIPETVLTSPPALVHLAEERSAATGHTVAQVTATEAVAALRVLHRLSLIDHDPGNPRQSVRVHQLIQRAVRDTLASGGYDQTARTAADALIDAWPDIERDTTLGQALRANAATLAGHAEEALHESDAYRVLFRAGRSLGEVGQVEAAREYFHHLTGSMTHYLGSNHPDTLATRYELAYWQGEAGESAAAAEAFAELLNDCLRILGPNHPNTLNTRNNLARWQGEAGDPAGAAEAFTELLNDRLRILGPNHPNTLTTRSNLARWQGEAGDPAGAAEAFTELLNDHLRILGPNHPNTLNTRGNLARWQGEAGDTTAAAKAHAELLNDRLRILGPNHPDTLNTRGNLAHWQGKAGDPAGAAEAFTELLNDHLRILGPNHPNTLTTQHNLASLRGETGDAAGAAEAFTELLNDHLRILGPNHPNTLTTQHNLAYWQEQAQAAATQPDANSKAAQPDESEP